MSHKQLPIAVQFEDDLNQLQQFLKLQTDRKIARVSDYTLDNELEKASIAIAQLVTTKANLHKQYIESMGRPVYTPAPNAE